MMMEQMSSHSLCGSRLLSYDTEIEIKLYVDGIRYWYQLAVNPEKVCREALFVYLTNRPTKVFCREDVQGVSKLTFNSTVAKLSPAEVDIMTMNCLRNMSVLAVLKKSISPCLILTICAVGLTAGCCLCRVVRFLHYRRVRRK